MARTPDWQLTLRQRMRTAAAAEYPGRWAVTLAADGERLRVQYRPPAGQGDTAESAYLPLTLDRTAARRDALVDLLAAAARLRAKNGLLSLRAAITQAATSDNTRSGSWESIAAEFRLHKLSAGITEATWEHDYEKVLASAVELMASSAAPATAPALVRRIVNRWAAGSRSRQQGVNSLCSWLSWAVRERYLPSEWAEGLDRSDLIGTAPAEVRNAAKRNRAISASDAELVAVIDAITPADAIPTAARRRWQSALRLMALCGLRPIEVLHLELRTMPDGNAGLFCNYAKRAGAHGVTEHRWLVPMLLERSDGSLTSDWWADLLLQFKTRTWEVPPALLTGNSPADNLRTFLMRQPAWCELRKYYAAKNYSLTAYAFRDSYARRCHDRGLSTADASVLMGHSEQVHVSSYPYRDSEAAVMRATRVMAQLGAQQDSLGH